MFVALSLVTPMLNSSKSLTPETSLKSIICFRLDKSISFSNFSNFLSESSNTNL
jgi:hypothetical protein